MKRERISFVVVLIIGFMILGGSIIMIVGETNINLRKADVIVGRVTWRGLVDAKPRSGVRRFFSFTLDNSNQRFAIHHTEERYSDLLYNVQPGDTVKVYYHAISQGFNLHVFQLEKNGKLLQDPGSYEKDISATAELMMMCGIILIVVAIVTYRKVNVFKWLDSLVRA